MNTYPSPIGTIYLEANEKGLSHLSFKKPKTSGSSNLEVIKETKAALRKYFSGELNALSKLKLNPEGTDFQKKVWKEARKIRASKTLSYMELAQKVGSPKAYRAVGTALGKNPICLAIPCHRVLSSNGKLGGFSQGLKRKEFLLKIEKAGGSTPK